MRINLIKKEFLFIWWCFARTKKKKKIVFLFMTFFQQMYWSLLEI